MKKSEINVTMPMTSYEELLCYKDKYMNLVNCINNFFKTECFETENRIDFNVNEALNVCKCYLPNRFQSANFLKTY